MFFNAESAENAENGRQDVKRKNCSAGPCAPRSKARGINPRATAVFFNAESAENAENGRQKVKKKKL